MADPWADNGNMGSMQPGHNQWMSSASAPSSSSSGLSSSSSSSLTGGNMMQQIPAGSMGTMGSGPMGGSMSNAAPAQAGSSGSWMMGSMKAGAANVSLSETDFVNEPPLLEELGVNPTAIISKTMVVVNPLKPVDHSLMEDSDLAGPMAYIFILGAMLLLAGKLHFGYLFGFGVFGSLSLSVLFNLMAQTRQINFLSTLSIVGYSLLPLVGLARVSIFIDLRGIVGGIAGTTAVLWCVFTSARFIEAALDMPNHRWLLAYPLAIFFSSFVLLTIF